MKSYPSIEKKGNIEQVYHVFDKVDGSNLRFEWNKKKGFFKYGTRTRLFDETDPTFGRAIPVWHAELAEPMHKLAYDQRWESVVFFAEFYGLNSFAGQHDLAETQKLYMIDIAPFKQGILGPEEYLKYVDAVPHAEFLGRYQYNADFVEQVRLKQIQGIGAEGIIGKRGSGHKLEMFKAKTQEWMDRIRANYSREEAERLLAS